MPEKAKLKFRFDGKNAAAQRVAASQAARLVTQVGAETRDAIRALITRSIRDGIPPYEAARMIRGMVGMDAGSAMAALNYREELINGGMRMSRVDQLVQTYANRKIRERAVTIARTEIMGALNRGAQVGWSQAQKKGFLGKEAEQEWMTAQDERICPVCGGLSEQRQPLKEPFRSVFGGKLIPYPPAHPRCRCTIALVPGAVVETRLSNLLPEVPAPSKGSTSSWAKLLPTSPTRMSISEQIAYAKDQGFVRTVAIDAKVSGQDAATMLRQFNAVREELLARGVNMPPMDLNLAHKTGKEMGHWSSLNKLQYDTTTLMGKQWSDEMLASFKDTWSSTDFEFHTLVHELGHAGHHFNAPVVSAARGLASADAATARLVSRYAATNEREFVAEVFARRVLRPDLAEDPRVTELYKRLRGPQLTGEATVGTPWAEMMAERAKRMAVKAAEAQAKKEAAEAIARQADEMFAALTPRQRELINILEETGSGHGPEWSALSAGEREELSDLADQWREMKRKARRALED